MSALSSISAAITTAMNVTSAVIETGGSTICKTLEGTEQYADAFRRTGVVTNRTAQLYEIEALGKAKARAKELDLDINFE
jgi:hypothetical protein